MMEMSTRLQVEHGVSGEVSGIDLVRAQVRPAASEPPHGILPTSIQPRGHAVQARVYAEDPKRFLPSPGTLSAFDLPSGHDVRVETGYRRELSVTPHYDPLLAKVIARGATRAKATQRLDAALGAFVIEGVRHNIPALRAIPRSDEFVAGDVHTGLAMQMVVRQAANDVEAKGQACR